MKTVNATVLGGLWALERAWQTCLSQSIGIDKTNSIVGATVFRGLWALEWA